MRFGLNLIQRLFMAKSIVLQEYTQMFALLSVYAVLILTDSDDQGC